MIFAESRQVLKAKIVACEIPGMNSKYTRKNPGSADRRVFIEVNRLEYLSGDFFRRDGDSEAWEI